MVISVQNYHIHIVDGTQFDHIVKSNLSSGGQLHDANRWQSLYDGVVPRAGELYLLADKVAYEISLPYWSNHCNGTTQLEYVVPNSMEDTWWGLSPADLDDFSINISATLDYRTMTLTCATASLPIHQRIVVPLDNITDHMPDISWPDPQMVKLGKPKAWSTVLKANGSWPFRNFGSSKSYSAPLSPLSSAASIQIALPFMVVVIICNACKMAVIFWMVRKSFENRIVMQGDAIALFLERPESLTHGFCMTDKIELVEQMKTRQRHSSKPWHVYRHPQGRNVRARWRSNIFV
jgi:hypothetical protein